MSGNWLGHPSAEHFLPPLSVSGILFCYLNYSVFCCVLEAVCAVGCSALGPLSSLPSGLAPLLFQAWWSGGGLGTEYPWQMLPSSGHCVSVLTDYQ